MSPLSPCSHVPSTHASMRVRCGRACDPGRRSLPARPTVVSCWVQASWLPSVSLAWDSVPKWVRGSEDVRKKGAPHVSPAILFRSHLNMQSKPPRYFALRTHCPSPIAHSVFPFLPFARCPVSAGWDRGRSKNQNSQSGSGWNSMVRPR